MKTWITKYDEELLEKSKVFLKASYERPESCAMLDKYGYSAEERERGSRLIANTERSFQWLREGRAWNFIGLTETRRLQEAHDWYKDTRNRYVADCFRDAEEESGWVGYRPASQWPFLRKLTVGSAVFVRHAVRAFSFGALLQHRRELQQNLSLAAQERPQDAPPPKDTALVELAGWYERWRLLAQRVFRQRPDLMTPYGLKPGKAPPRLRSKVAQLRYGEGAAGKLPIINGTGLLSGQAEVDEGDEAAAAEA